MISLYFREENKFVKKEFNAKLLKTKTPAWIDIYKMTPKEEKILEKTFGINIPSIEEMSEIEVSSRLYHKNHTLYMTASLLSKSESEPELSAVTFMIFENTLITIRYSELSSFKNIEIELDSISIGRSDANLIYSTMIDNIIDRIADILENIGRNIDQMAKKIFRSQTSNGDEKIDFKKILEEIGREGDLVSKICESIISINRMILFAVKSPIAKFEDESKDKLEIHTKDIIALNDHAYFLSNKINFLLDATLGMVTIEQNNIIKIFSVAAVISLPPTLIASIYGMNFKIIPELDWDFGYPLAIIIMILSAFIPYKYFRLKKLL